MNDGGSNHSKIATKKTEREQYEAAMEKIKVGLKLQKLKKISV